MTNVRFKFNTDNIVVNKLVSLLCDYLYMYKNLVHGVCGCTLPLRMLKREKEVKIKNGFYRSDFF